MMRITLIAMGKLKEQYWRDACAEYQKRLSRFCKLKILELPEGKTLELEAEEILPRCRGKCFALSPAGRELSSEEFAKTVQTLSNQGLEATFIIGSSEGLSKRVLAASDEMLSFSKLTFPHQMFRAVFLEQLYRAFMINSGAVYHK